MKSSCFDYCLSGSILFFVFLGLELQMISARTRYVDYAAACNEEVMGVICYYKRIFFVRRFGFVSLSSACLEKARNDVTRKMKC